MVYLGVRTSELYICLAPFDFVDSIVLTSLFCVFYVTAS